jgi:pimeloyl-ACP methyl ester carboxylesterase
MTVSSHDLRLTDGRVLRVHDAGPADGSEALTLLWHHGSPQTGALLEPVLAAAAGRGIRVLSYARPSYGGSSPHRGRTVASAADDVAQLADALGLGTFAVMGHSGGGPHALGCAALLPDRLVGAVALACIAPYTEAFDWFDGMVAPGGLKAALGGTAAREAFAEIDEFDMNSFTAADWKTLGGAWASLGRDAEAAGAAGQEGLVDDDLAFARSWGFDVAATTVPVLLVQGGEDRVVPPSHADWLLRAGPTSELWLRPHDGHIAVLDGVPVAMDWLLAQRG